MTPTLTPTDVATLTSTAVATGIAAATSTPPVEPVSVELTLDRTLVAADGRSTATVTATVLGAPGLDLNGVTVFFNVSGGGQVEPDNTPLIGRSAVTTYVAGEAVDQQEVAITATLDLVDQGRVQGQATVLLTREELSIEPETCAYLTGSAGGAIAVSLASNYPEAHGEYRLHAVAAGEGSVITNTAASSFYARTGALPLQYIPAPGSTSGTDSVCVDILSRPAQASYCQPVIYGADNLNLQIDVPDEIHWLLDSSLVHRFTLRDDVGALQSAFIAHGYDVLLHNAVSDPIPVEAPFREIPSPGECSVLYTEQFSFAEYRVKPLSAVIEWQYLLPGSSPKGYQRHLILAAQPVRFADTAFDNDGQIRVIWPDLGSVRVFSPDWRLHATQPYDPNMPETEVIASFYVEKRFVDESGTSFVDTLRAIPARTTPWQPQTPYDLLFQIENIDALKEHLYIIDIGITEIEPSFSWYPVENLSNNWVTGYTYLRVDTSLLVPLWN